MKYELTYIISSDLNLQGAEEKVKTVESFVSEKGGAISSKEGPTAKTLGYPVEGKASGFSVTNIIETEPEAVPSIQSFLMQDKDILRAIVLKGERKPIIVERRESIVPKPFKIEKKSSSAIPLRHSSAGQEATEDKEVSDNKEEKPVDLEDIEKQLDKILNE